MDRAQNGCASFLLMLVHNLKSGCPVGGPVYHPSNLINVKFCEISHIISTFFSHTVVKSTTKRITWMVGTPSKSWDKPPMAPPWEAGVRLQQRGGFGWGSPSLPAEMDG